uniref:Protein kinase domain-containing protein n=1 Tax=Stegastes partitus TaxID=144197 RepID=A0A3B5A3D6_9TELE
TKKKRKRNPCHTGNKPNSVEQRLCFSKKYGYIHTYVNNFPEACTKGINKVLFYSILFYIYIHTDLQNLSEASTGTSFKNVTLSSIFKGSKLGKRHIVEDILGEGGFGVVAKCQNMCTGRTEAVKVNRCEPDDMYQAFVEISLLKRLRCLNADTCNIVEWNGYFFHEENICMTFEVLDVSLDTYLTQRGNPGLPVTEIRPVLHQVATALSHLHSIGVVHLDLKPENIMVVDRTQQPVRVKIIDFGLSGLLSEIKQGLRQGSTWYMAPEMILAAPLNETLDMWSLGVIAAELAMGCPLYPGNIDYDVLSYIVETQGQPPDDKRPLWRIKSPEEFHHDSGCHPEGRRNSRLSCLDDIGHRMARQAGHHSDQQTLLSLIKSMLHLDAGQRVKAREALQHPFFLLKKKYRRRL